MGVIDLVTRLDAICNKYDKFDVDKHHNNKAANINSDDAFARLFGLVEADLNTALQKAETVATEKNRARAVAVNAEIRRTKARLLEEIPKLQRLAFKRVKGMSKEELEARSELVAVLKERAEAVPDGSNTRTVGGGANAVEGGQSGAGGIKFDFNYEEEARLNDEYFRTTEETEQFRNEYEMRRMKQDRGLDVIAEGLDNLKNMTHDINEEFDKQLPLMDEIDDKVDRAASDLRSNNVRLKDTVNQLRSSRNFCIDIILLILILGISAYLYNVLK